MTGFIIITSPTIVAMQLVLLMAFLINRVNPLLELIIKGKDHTPWKGEHPDFLNPTTTTQS
jgi:hypothetical protein